MSTHSLRLGFSWLNTTDVFIGENVLHTMQGIWRQDWQRAVVVGDRTVLGLFSDAIEGVLSKLTDSIEQISFEPGEASKTRKTKEFIEDSMFEAGVGRTCCVVAVGGGVSLDLAGFVAATYMRGVDWICIPTSLLAQVDASVGGKTGVDTTFGKNLVGAFHQPAAVLSNISWLSSLPELQWSNGLSEMVKTAWIADEKLVQRLERRAESLAAAKDMDPDLVFRCVQIKARLIEADEREAGPRAWLNFGHTVAHSVERASAYRVPHGLAVAFGMVVESRIASLILGMDASVVERLQELLSRLNIPFMQPVDFESAYVYLAADKKNRASKLRMALPSAVGKMARDASGLYTVEVDEQLVREAWKP